MPLFRSSEDDQKEEEASDGSFEASSGGGQFTDLLLSAITEGVESWDRSTRIDWLEMTDADENLESMSDKALMTVCEENVMAIVASMMDVSDEELKIQFENRLKSIGVTQKCSKDCQRVITAIACLFTQPYDQPKTYAELLERQQEVKEETSLSVEQEARESRKKLKASYARRCKLLYAAFLGKEDRFFSACLEALRIDPLALETFAGAFLEQLDDAALDDIANLAFHGKHIGAIERILLARLDDGSCLRLVAAMKRRLFDGHKGAPYELLRTISEAAECPSGPIKKFRDVAIDFTASALALAATLVEGKRWNIDDASAFLKGAASNFLPPEAYDIVAHARRVGAIVQDDLWLSRNTANSAFSSKRIYADLDRHGLFSGEEHNDAT